MKIDFFDRIKQLPKGQLRKYIVISLSIPLLGFVLLNFTNSDFFGFIAIFGFFLFWIGVRIYLWVQDGYKEDNGN